MSKLSEGDRAAIAPNLEASTNSTLANPELANSNLLKDPEPWRALKRPGGDSEELRGSVDVLKRLQLHRLAPRWSERVAMQIAHYRQVHDGLSTQAGDPMPPELFNQWGTELTQLLKIKDLKIEVVPNELAHDQLGHQLPDGVSHDRSQTPLAYLRHDTLQLKAALFSGNDLEAVRERVAVVIGKMLALKAINEDPASFRVKMLKSVARSIGFKDPNDQIEVAANILNLSRRGYFKRVLKTLSPLTLIPPLSVDVLVGQSDMNLPGLQRKAALGQAASEMGKGSSLAALHPEDAARLQLVYKWVSALASTNSRIGSEYAFAVATQVAFATRSLGGSVEAIAGALLTAISPEVRTEFATRTPEGSWQKCAVSLAAASDDLFTRVFRPAAERPGLKLSHSAETSRGVFLQRASQISRDHGVAVADLVGLVFARDLRESAYRWRDVKGDALEPLYRKMIMRSAMVASSLLHGREGWYVETVRDEAYRVRSPEKFKRARDNIRSQVGTSYGASIMRLHRDDHSIYNALREKLDIDPVLLLSNEKSVYAVGSKDRELRDLSRRRIIVQTGGDVIRLASAEGDESRNFVKMFWQMPPDIAPPRRDRWNEELGAVRLNVLREDQQRPGNLSMEELSIMSLPWYDVYSVGEPGYPAYWQYKCTSWNDAGFPKQDFQIFGPSLLRKDRSSIMPWQEYLDRTISSLSKFVYVEVVEGLKGEVDAPLDRAALRSCQLPSEARAIDLLARYNLHPSRWEVEEVNIVSIGEGSPRAELQEVKRLGSRSRLSIGASYRFVKRESPSADSSEDDLSIFADGRTVVSKLLSQDLSELDKKTSEERGRAALQQKFGEIDQRFEELVIEPAAEHLGFNSKLELYRACGFERYAKWIIPNEIEARVSRHFVETQVAVDYNANRWAVKLNQDHVGMLARYLECAREAQLGLASFSSSSTNVGDGCQITFDFDRNASEVGVRRFVKLARGIRFERTTNSKNLPVYAPVMRELDFLLVDRPFVAVEVARCLADLGYRILNFEVSPSVVRRDVSQYPLRRVRVSTIGPDSYLPSSEQSIASASSELSKGLKELSLAQVDQRASAKRQAREKRRQGLVHELKINAQ